MAGIESLEQWHPSFDELPDQLSEYIRFIEKETGIPIEMVSIGPTGFKHWKGSD
jgi:adenylosuccinate synthase